MIERIVGRIVMRWKGVARRASKGVKGRERRFAKREAMKCTLHDPGLFSSPTHLQYASRHSLSVTTE
jgi:hypothetical protein